MVSETRLKSSLLGPQTKCNADSFLNSRQLILTECLNLGT
jgi:hypothetical protein